MTERLDYVSAAPGGMKVFGGVHGYVAQSGLERMLINPNPLSDERSTVGRFPRS